MNLIKVREIACLIGAAIFTIFPSIGVLAIVTVIKTPQLQSSAAEISALIWGAVIILQWGLFYTIFRSYN